MALLGSDAVPLAAQVRPGVPPSDTIKPVMSPVDRGLLEQKLENAARAHEAKATVLQLQKVVQTAYTTPRILSVLRKP